MKVFVQVLVLVSVPHRAVMKTLSGMREVLEFGVVVIRDNRRTIIVSPSEIMR
ncbi:MAG: hypothetical protein HGA41_10750 [Syntrophaceae bacterium]|nr:hypothetical protein [Syntrophaceae bacterium]